MTLPPPVRRSFFFVPPLFLPSRDEEMISIDHFQPELCSCARIQPRQQPSPRVHDHDLNQTRSATSSESRPSASLSVARSNNYCHSHRINNGQCGCGEREREGGREGGRRKEGAATFIIYSLLSNGIRRSFGGSERRSQLLLIINRVVALIENPRILI